jgi:hypothetical protein
MLNIERFSIDEGFERRTVRISRPDSSSLYYITTRLLEFPGVFCSAFSRIANPQGLRALMHRELPFRFQ